MITNNIRSAQPFKQWYSYAANIIDLYSVVERLGYQAIINAVTSYIAKLNAIITNSSLYTYTAIISKYLIDCNYDNDRDIIKSAVFDSAINKMIDSNPSYSNTLNNSSIIETLKDMYISAHTSESFDMKVFEMYKGTLPHNFIQSLKYSMNDMLQSYYIGSAEGQWTTTMKDPIDISVNGTCIASLGLDPIDALTSNYGFKYTYIYLQSGIVIRCTDRVNNVHALTHVDKYAYDGGQVRLNSLTVYGTPVNINITSINYTIRIFKGVTKIDEYKLNIEYPPTANT